MVSNFFTQHTHTIHRLGEKAWGDGWRVARSMMRGSGGGFMLSGCVPIGWCPSRDRGQRPRCSVTRPATKVEKIKGRILVFTVASRCVVFPTWVVTARVCRSHDGVQLSRSCMLEVKSIPMIAPSYNPCGLVTRFDGAALAYAVNPNGELGRQGVLGSTECGRVAFRDAHWLGTSTG